MYSENDLAKAHEAVKAEMVKQFHDDPGYVNWDMKAIAKAALDAQYLPAQAPPSEGSRDCMIYKGAAERFGL